MNLSASTLQSNSDYRFSGHESFTCRYGWLPKLYQLVVENPSSYRDDEVVMVSLGIGRNMVKSLRFWVSAFGLIDESTRTTANMTPLAHELFEPNSGTDPYLEDINTLWLLHWHLTAKSHLAAWNIAFFNTPESEVLKQVFIDKLDQLAKKQDKTLSASTVKQHLDIFLKSYAALSSGNGSQANAEESLACPLQELGLIQVVGADNNGAKDTRILFNRGPWPHLSTEIFLRILLEFWEWRAPHDSTLSLRALLLDYGSPGLVLRLDQNSLLDLLGSAAAAFPKVIKVDESIDLQSIHLPAGSVDHAKKVFSSR